MESHATTPELWQLAVKLHVLLCYPAAPADRRQALENAIGAQLVGVTLEHLRRDFPEEFAVYSARLAATYQDYDAKALRRISERFIHQHELALRAGAFILALISKAAIGRFPNFVGGDRQPTMNEAARYVLGANGRADDEDSVHQFLKVKIRPWYPVAHLVAAFQLMAKKSFDRGAGMSFDYQDTAFFAEVLRRADEAADHIRATPNAKGIAKRLVSLSEFDRLRG